MKYTNYKLTISYDGTLFSGWQKQTGRETDTVQGRLEAVASRLAGEPVPVNGAGRTDAGVSALCQVANVKLPGEMKADELLSYFNRYLPETVSVDRAEICPERFHARLNASRKTYTYCVWLDAKPPVFGRKYVYCEERPIDLARLRREASSLLGKHDMLGFSSLRNPAKSTIRTIFSVEAAVDGARRSSVMPDNKIGGIKGGVMPGESLRNAACGGMPTLGPDRGRMLLIQFTGDGFLYNQVRIMTGTLLDVAAGRLPAGTVAKVLETGDRQLAGFTAPPNALFLTDVSYGTSGA